MAKFPNKHEYQQQLCQGFSDIEGWQLKCTWTLSNSQHKLLTEFCSIYISRNVLNSLTRLVSRLWPNNLVNFTVWCRSFPELEMFSTVRCHFTERRLMTRSCFITPASPPQSHDEQVAHLPHIGPGFLPPDDTSHSSDKKDINNVDSCVDEGQF